MGKLCTLQEKYACASCKSQIDGSKMIRRVNFMQMHEKHELSERKFVETRQVIWPIDNVVRRNGLGGHLPLKMIDEAAPMTPKNGP